MFKRIYIEITNVCNLSCSFCPKTKRKPRFMSVSEFETIAARIRPFTDYIYLHVLGEPLMHPELNKILNIASEYDFQVNITTNGTMLQKKADLLLRSVCIRKISVSLHSFEGNNSSPVPSELISYIDEIWDFCKKTDKIIALRLWNEGGANAGNELILDRLSYLSGKDIRNIPMKVNSRKISRNIYLESAEKFEWPIQTTSEHHVTYCHGLSQQIAVLCDGTVVPCCLDSEGQIPLGNLFEDDLEAIISSPRANNMLQGFKDHKPSEELCRKCGYATRFR